MFSPDADGCMHAWACVLGIGKAVLQDEAGRRNLQVGKSSSCPVLAVRHASRDSKEAPGWSLILPGAWVGPFWQALVYQGARPAGQREWRWVAAYQARRLLLGMQAIPYPWASAIPVGSLLACSIAQLKSPQ